MIPPDNPVNAAPMDIIFFGKFFCVDSRLMFAGNFLFRFLAEFCSKSISDWPFRPALLRAISHIDFLVSGKKMFRVAAWGIIAAVADGYITRHFRQRNSIRKGIRNSMRPHFPRLFNRDFPIAAIDNGTSPWPTFTRSTFIHLRPKAI